MTTDDKVPLLWDNAKSSVLQIYVCARVYIVCLYMRKWVCGKHMESSDIWLWISMQSRYLYSAGVCVRVCVCVCMCAGFTGPGFDIHATPPTHWGPISGSFTYLWKTDWKERERREPDGRREGGWQEKRREGEKEIDGEKKSERGWERGGKREKDQARRLHSPPSRKWGEKAGCVGAYWEDPYSYLCVNCLSRWQKRARAEIKAALHHGAVTAGGHAAHSPQQPQKYY